ncbi:hypothetical protein ES695_14445 [Candidatus Atribacteria bacterium 1244-E10-H5-B2]|nr:MAG: hypothetical protein ES695_14445 [Candidatus Atribacteria bacterium 1244-E10-H5-B2]
MNYQGNGEVTLINDEIYKCSFELYQKQDSGIVLWCKFIDYDLVLTLIISEKFNVKKFKGKTKDKFECFAKNNLDSFYITYFDKKNTVFYLKEIEIITNNKKNENVLCFKITNFCLNKLENFELSLSDPHKDKNQKLSFLVRPLDNFEEINRNLRINRDVETTSEIIYLNNDNSPSFDQIIEILDDICHLLSMAQGTKIQWISYKFYKDSYVHEKYLNRVTSSYAPFFIIAQDINSIKNFIETVYSTFIERKDTYHLKWIINAFLDSKSEGRYLGTRGLRAVVVMEMLRGYFLKTRNIDDDIFQPMVFRKIRKNIKKEIERILEYDIKNNVDLSVEKKMLFSKIPELNRKPFKEILIRFLESINFDVEKENDNIKCFIKSRNALVHRGQFFYDIYNESDCKYKSSFEEFTFIINFIDKVILKLIGYSGLYQNIYQTIQNGGWREYENI